MAYYHSSYGHPRKKKKTFRKFMFVFFLIIIIAAGALAFTGWKLIYNPNVWTQDNKIVSVKIPTNADFEQVKEILYSKGLIIHRNNFEFVADLKKYPQNIKSGNYEIKGGMNNNELINLLRSGNQTPVKVIFNNIQDVYTVASKVSAQLECDSSAIVDYVFSSSFMNNNNLDSVFAGMIFLPNTYEFYWNTTAEGFVERMNTEFNKFWNAKRNLLAQDIGLSKKEVIVLASIVEKETQKNDEKAKIAGVYLNRLKRKWLLQADPTLIYALNDKSIRRVLNVHKKIDSPYNTYKHLGLPPGPICIPSISSIDAVLNYDKSDYLFFCAKADLSGYHAFAKTIKQHNRNAKKYQEALNKLKIYK